jgi:hypothetical protein
MHPFGGQTRETLPLQMFANLTKKGLFMRLFTILNGGYFLTAI